MNDRFSFYLVTSPHYEGFVKFGAALDVVQHAFNYWDGTPDDSLTFEYLKTIPVSDDVQEIADAIQDHFVANHNAHALDNELIAGRIGAWFKIDLQTAIDGLEAAATAVGVE